MAGDPIVLAESNNATYNHCEGLLVQLNPIRLGNHEFEGKNNAYLLESAGATALIDTGIHRPDIHQQLRDGLAEHDRSITDLDHIVLTHHHVDHTGLAGPLSAESGATVYVHRTDAPLVRRHDDALDAYEQLQERRFEEWHMPPDKRAELRAFFDQVPPVEPPERVVELGDGDELELGDVSLHARHAPGHTAGHCTFEFTHDGSLECFVGDVVLPVYTPNVGGADLRLEHALAHYLETLREIVEREYDRAWPGHREVIEDPAGRAETIIAHHHERTENVIDVLDTESALSAWEESEEVFGSLEAIHILHGPGEAYSHLEHLVDNDAVERIDDGYRLLDETVDLDAVLATPVR